MDWSITWTLLLLAGFIWGAILHLVAKFLSQKWTKKPWKNKVVSAFMLIGMLPLLAEYYHFYAFKQYCETNGDFVTINPVHEDSISFRGSSDYLWGVFNSSRVNYVDFQFVGNGRASFVNMYVKSPEPDQDCILKTVGVYEKERGVIPRELVWMKMLGICVIGGKIDPAPKYALQIRENEDWWEIARNYKKNATHFSMALLDEKTGSIETEFKNVITVAGPFLSAVYPNWYPQYSCTEKDMRIQDNLNGRWSFVSDFLDIALLPVERNSN